MATPSSSRCGARILIVDDEEKVCIILQRVLRPPHEVTAFSSPRRALEHLQGGASYDLILCDLQMPELSGPALYEELLQNRPEQAARMVFMTGDAHRPAHREFLDRVAKPHIEKPFDIERIRELASSCLPQSST